MKDELIKEELKKTVDLLKERNIDIFITADADDHLSEFTSPHYKCMEYISGFTGGDGTLVISKNEAFLWTDGRYFVQAEKELENSGIKLMKIGEPGYPDICDWIVNNLSDGGTLAFNGKCVPAIFVEGLIRKLKERNKKFKIDSQADLIDEIWQERPEEIYKSCVVLPEKYTGRSVKEKICELKKAMSDQGAQAHIMTSPDDIAWLLNMRGGDVPNTPVFSSFLLIDTAQSKKEDTFQLKTEDIAQLKTEEVAESKREESLELQTEDIARSKIEEDTFSKNDGKCISKCNLSHKCLIKLYITEKHLTEDVIAHLTEAGIEICTDTDMIYSDIADICADYIIIEKNIASYQILKSIPEKTEIIDMVSPCAILKSRKNEVETENLRNIQLKDSVVMTKFMYYFKKSLSEQNQFGGNQFGRDLSKRNLSEENQSSASQSGINLSEGNKSSQSKSEISRSEVSKPEGILTEKTAAKKLHELRMEQVGFIEDSFPTISAYAENAAMCHYNPEENDQDVKILPSGLYLVDSGGQYLEGTTDVTRTWSCGDITEMQKTLYTITAVANLRLADAIFPEGTSALTLDYAAREIFWREGLNYNHGTGHGVGCCLSVHERPYSIRYKADKTNELTAMHPGVYISDEPGFYQENEFGIRLENMLIVVKDKVTGYGQFLKFETLTHVPFDRECMDPEIMTERDISLYNAYHEKVYELISEHLNSEEQAWLKEACRPL